MRNEGHACPGMKGKNLHEVEEWPLGLDRMRRKEALLKGMREREEMTGKEKRLWPVMREEKGVCTGEQVPRIGQEIHATCQSNSSPRLSSFHQLLRPRRSYVDWEVNMMASTLPSFQVGSPTTTTRANINLTRLRLDSMLLSHDMDPERDRLDWCHLEPTSFVGFVRSSSLVWK